MSEFNDCSVLAAMVEGYTPPNPVPPEPKTTHSEALTKPLGTTPSRRINNQLDLRGDVDNG